jgi:multidrug transporter EmrE-like cation transporter
VKTPFSSMLLVLVASFIGSFGAVFLKSGAGRLHRQFRTLLLNWRLALGVGFYLVSSFFFVLGVRQGELTVLYPMVSLGYVWTLLWSRLFFRESITRNKLLGIGLVLVGVVLLNLGNR